MKNAHPVRLADRGPLAHVFFKRTLTVNEETSIDWDILTGIVLAANGRFEESEKFLAELLKADPSMELTGAILYEVERVLKKETDHRVSSHFFKGIFLAYLKLWRDATVQFDKVIEVAPDHADAYFYRGLVRMSTPYEYSISDFTRAIEAEPSFAAAYYVRGILYSFSGDRSRAVTDFTKYIEFKPSAAMAYLNRGLANSRMGFYQRAISDFTRSIEIKPDNGWAYFERAKTYLSDEQRDNALSDYTRAIELEYNLSASYDSRGQIYLSAGRNKEAISNFTELIELDPGNAEAFYSRGMAFERLYKFDEALSDYTTGIDMGLNNYVERGLVYLRKLNDITRGCADLTRACEAFQSCYEYEDTYIKGLSCGERAKGKAPLGDGPDARAVLEDAGLEFNAKGFFSAAKKGHIDAIRLYVRAGMDVDIKGERSDTALTLAVMDGHIDTVRFLIESGADLNRGKYLGETPLITASWTGEERIVRLLLESGAEIDATGNNGRTALNSAASNGKVDICKLLLESGAYIENSDNDRYTPLMRAVSSGLTNVADLFIEHGADISALNVVNKYGSTILNRAVWLNDLSMVKFLIKHGADVNIENDYGETPLRIAVQKMNIDIIKTLKNAGVESTESLDLLIAIIKDEPTRVERLLTEGADIDYTVGYGYQTVSPLLLAIKFGRTGIVTTLIDASANLNPKDTRVDRPLTRAAEVGDIEIVKMLLAAGADVDGGAHCDIICDTVTSITRAADNKHHEIVRMLLTAGADVDAMAPDGLTALIAATFRDDLETVKLLLENGADINKKNYYRSAFDIALEEDHTAIIALMKEKLPISELKDDKAKPATAENREALSELEKRGIEFETHNFRKAARIGDNELLQLFIKAGVDIESKSNDGKTALSLAAFNSKMETVELLLKSGAEVNTVNIKGNSPLTYAVSEEHAGIVNLLLKAGADPNLTGNTLLFATTIDDTEIIRTLLNNGADPNSWDDCKFKCAYGGAILSASEYGRTEMVKILISSGADVNVDMDDQVEGPVGTALMLAAVGGHIEIVRILLESGADIEGSDYLGSTALVWTAMAGHTEIVKYLVDRDADLNARGDFGTALDSAKEDGFDKIVDILERAAQEKN